MISERPVSPSIRYVVQRIEAIFLYQFVVYFFIWCWAVGRAVTDGLSQGVTVYLLAPPVVLLGYVFKTRKAVLLCAAGDLMMACSVGKHALSLFRDEGVLSLSTLIVATIALCMSVRFIRDILLFIWPMRE